MIQRKHAQFLVAERCQAGSFIVAQSGPFRLQEPSGFASREIKALRPLTNTNATVECPGRSSLLQKVGIVGLAALDFISRHF